MQPTTKVHAKRHTLSNALRVAALQYQTDAEVHRVEPAGGEGLMLREARASIVRCFEDQAKEANALADEIDEKDVLWLED